MTKKKFGKTICFDLDGVLCSLVKSNYSKSKPIKKNIKAVNDLYDSGHIIIIFTARYMGRTKNNRLLAIKKGMKLTIRQLKKWRVKYHKLILGKPSYDLVVDDKSIFYNKNWSKLITKKI